MYWPRFKYGENNPFTNLTFDPNFVEHPGKMRKSERYMEKTSAKSAKFQSCFAGHGGAHRVQRWRWKKWKQLKRWTEVEVYPCQVGSIKNDGNRHRQQQSSKSTAATSSSSSSSSAAAAAAPAAAAAKPTNRFEDWCFYIRGFFGGRDVCTNGSALELGGICSLANLWHCPWIE